MVNLKKEREREMFTWQLSEISTKITKKTPTKIK